MAAGRNAANNELENWLRINTFECPHGLGRISPEQCKANRNRPKSTVTESAALQPSACSGCTQHEELCKQIYDKRKKDNRPTRKCRICKSKKPLSSYRKSKITGNHITVCDDCERRLELGPYKATTSEKSERA